MCGRVRLSTDYSEIKIKVKFDAAYPAPNIAASWNVCPTDPMRVAVRSEEPATVDELKALLVPFEDDALKVWPVNRQRIGNVRNKALSR